MRSMLGSLGLDRDGILDSVVTVISLIIIVVLTLLFVAYNPWGWEDWLVTLEVFGLHLVPILTLVPVTYLLIKLLREAEEGRSDTADRIKSWFAVTDESEHAAEPDETRDLSANVER